MQPWLLMTLGSCALANLWCMLHVELILSIRKSCILNDTCRSRNSHPFKQELPNMRDFLLATAETIVSARCGHGMFPCGQMGQVRWLNWFHTWQAWSYCYVTPQGTTRRSARSSMCSCNLWLWLIKWTSINLVKWSFSRWLDAVHWADLPQDLLAELARQCFAAGIVHDFSGALFGIFWILVLTARDSPVSSSQFTLY